MNSWAWPSGSTRVVASACEGPDQPVRDAHGGWDLRQGVPGEPAGLEDLIGVRIEFTSGVFCGEGNHQGIREGPGLAAEVAEVLHCEADLFLNLTVDGCFQVLPWLHKARQYAEEGVSVVAIAGQQDPVAVHHRHDDCWADLGEKELTAGRAGLGPFVLLQQQPPPQAPQ